MLYKKQVGLTLNTSLINRTSPRACPTPDKRRTLFMSLYVFSVTVAVDGAAQFSESLAINTPLLSLFALLGYPLPRDSALCATDDMPCPGGNNLRSSTHDRSRDARAWGGRTLSYSVVDLGNSSTGSDWGATALGAGFEARVVSSRCVHRVARSCG